PGRSAIDELLPWSIRRDQIRPNEQSVSHQPRRLRQRRQQRRLSLQHRREQRTADIRVAAFDRAEACECPELRQLFRPQVLPRLLLQRKLSKRSVEFARLRDSSLLCRSDAGTGRRPRDTVTAGLPLWLLRRFQSLGAPIIVNDLCAHSPKK